MVTKTRKMVTIPEAEKIILESNTKEEMVERLNELPIRQPRQKAPEGSISVRRAAKRYGVSRSTISRWANSGIIKIIKRTTNWLYLDDESIKSYINSRKN